MPKKITEFTDLKAWQVSKQLTLHIYKLTKHFPKEELFGLTSQMRRASVSVNSNLAEGFGRLSQKEKIQFYFRAHSSLTEIHSQLIIANELNYVKTKDFEVGLDHIKQTGKLINGLIRAINKHIK